MKNLKSLAKKIGNKKFRVYVTFVDWFDNEYKERLLCRDTLEEVIEEMNREKETNEWFQKVIIRVYKKTGHLEMRQVGKEVTLKKIGA